VADLTDDWGGFCALWLRLGAHLATYGHPPDYRKTADFLSRGGFMAPVASGEGARP
jgi:hypothetical protein